VGDWMRDHADDDNNLAERMLRLAVTKRKVSGASRSMERFKQTANLLTVLQTCRSQGRSVIEFFQQAIKEIVNPAVQAPSLIPQLEGVTRVVKVRYGKGFKQQTP